MSRKAEFTIQGMLISLLVVGLFMGAFGAIIVTMNGYYDTTGYDGAEIGKYNSNENLSSTLQSVNEDVDGVTVESDWFDFFSGIWSKLFSPFKFIYKSFGYLIGMFTYASDQFQLLPVFKQFFTSAIIVLVIVGVVLIKFGLGRKK